MKLEFTEVDLDWVLDQTTKTIKENKDAPIRALIVDYWNNRLAELIKPLEDHIKAITEIAQARGLAACEAEEKLRIADEKYMSLVEWMQSNYPGITLPAEFRHTRGRYCAGCKQTWPTFESWHDHQCEARIREGG